MGRTATGSTKLKPYSGSFFHQSWMPDSSSCECYKCERSFTIFLRRYHCRICGQIFCKRCCNMELKGKVIGYSGKLRSCSNCCNKVSDLMEHGGDSDALRDRLQEWRSSADHTIWHEFARLPKYGKPISSRREFMENLKPGQHYAIYRKSGYYHHFLVTEKDLKTFRIIHYARPKAVDHKTRAKRIFLLVTICEETVPYTGDEDLEIPGTLVHVEDPEYPTDEEGVEKVITRARERLGEINYNASYNNCETFVRWALTENPDSLQYEDATVGDKMKCAFANRGINVSKHVGKFGAAKGAKEMLYLATMAIDKAALKGGSRLVYDGVGTSMSKAAVNGLAQFGVSIFVDTIAIIVQCVRWWKSRKSGHITSDSFKNLLATVITEGAFSAIGTAVFAIVVQFLCPVPGVGLVLGGIAGGLLFRLAGFGLAKLGIALKEWHAKRKEAIQGS